MSLRPLGKTKIRMQVVGVMYLYGCLIYASVLAWDWFVRGVTWDLYWWQHLLAPLAAGLVGLALEAIGTFVGNGFSFNEKFSKLRRVAAFVGMFILLASLMIGLPMYQISKG